MKSKASIGILIVSILLTTGGILTPSARSSGPQVGLQVLPHSVVYNTPAWNTTFTVNVTLTNVTNLFGYEFKLSWNTTLLDCIATSVTPPWSSNYTVLANSINKTSGQYWLAVGAHSIGAFTGNASLVSLTFNVTYDPLQGSASSILHLFNTNLFDNQTPIPNTIDHNTYDGLYEIHAIRPVVQLLLLNATKAYVTSYKATAGGKTFTAEVWVFNVSGLTHFNYTLTYNTTLLDASVPTVPWNETHSIIKFPTIQESPYPSPTTFRNETTGTVGGVIDSATPAYGSGLLGRVSFTTRNNQTSNGSCVLNLTKTDLYSATVPIPHDTINALYNYTLLPGEAYGDNSVDMRDIYMVAHAYGTEPGDHAWNPSADLNGDGKIDIKDFMITAVNYGITINDP